jgi:hypothetical protein
MRRPLVASTVLVVALASVTAALSASAGPPGVWTKVTDGDRRNIDDVGLARTSNGVLHVLWQRRTGPIETSIVHTAVTTAGKVGKTNPVVTGLRTADNPAVLVLPGGSLQAFFASLGDTTGESGVTGAIAPASGIGWSRQGGRVSSTQTSVGPVGAALTADGTPAFAYSATSTLGVHIGTDAADADFSVRPDKKCCDYVPELATDPKTGQTVLAYYSNARGRSGTWVRPVAPKVGKPTRAPGSVTGGKSLDVDQHVALSARLGAPGVYVGYCSGYPVCKSTLLWRVGGGKPLKVGGSEDVEDVDVAPGPDGRLWVMWHDGRTKQLHATRTNQAATRIGPLLTLAPPKGTSNMWKLAGEGSLGPLDVLVSATVGGALQTWHTQVLPRLELSVQKSGTSVKLVVTDAGDPIGGATVTLGGKALKTNASGVATAAAPKGNVTATAATAGYQPATATVSG